MSGNTTGRNPKRQAARDRAQAAKTGRQAEQRHPRWITRAVVGALAVAVLGGLYLVYHRSASSSSGRSAAGGYQVGTPGKGQPAPGFSLAATTGNTVSLADYRGKTVLLYFQ